MYKENRNEGDPKEIDTGHMNPVFINTFDLVHMSNTFRYTNAVPHYKTSDGGKWREYERWLAFYAKQECAAKSEGSMYIYTGTLDKFVDQNSIPNPEAPLSITKDPEGHLVSLRDFLTIRIMSLVNATYSNSKCKINFVSFDVRTLLYNHDFTFTLLF